METEEVGMEITAELARNREKIESSRAKVISFHNCAFFPVQTLFTCILSLSVQAGEYSGITDSARRLIGSMNRRDTQQKYTAIFILVILMVIVILFIYYR